MNDIPLLRTPGELLSQARLEQSLTMDELSERTKIPPPVLEALEKDEYHKISGPLYIKSFLRTCAVDLGIDPGQVLDLYNKFAGEAQASSPGQEAVWRDEVEVSHVGLPWPRIIMVAGAVVVLVGLLLFSLRGCGDETAPGAFDAPATNEVADTGNQPAVGSGDSLAPAGDEPVHESLLPRDAVGHPDAGAERSATVAPKQSAPAPDDTLALGWILGKDQPVGQKPEPLPETSAADDGPPAVVADVPAQTPAAAVAETSPAVRRSPPEAPTTGSDEAAAAARPLVPGDPTVAFADGKIYPVVLKLMCEAPLRADIKRDGESAFLGALWPHTGKPAPAVPPGGVEQGWAYAADGRLVVFWGALDYFSLRLGQLDGVQVFVNGERRDLSGISAGDEFLVFPPAPDSRDGG